MVESENHFPINTKECQEYPSLFNENLHDSSVIKIIEEKYKLTLVLRIDTYWSKGKPFGILNIINPIRHEEFVKSCEIQPQIILGLEIKFREFAKGKIWPVVFIDVALGPPWKFEFICSNFWFDRLETYESEKFRLENAEFDHDMIESSIKQKKR